MLTPLSAARLVLGPLFRAALPFVVWLFAVAAAPVSLDAPELAALAGQVRAAGGAAIGAYRDPLGSHPLLLAVLPLEAIEPTPFQRDLSPAHVKRLAQKIDEARAFLDPLIVVRGATGGF